MYAELAVRYLHFVSIFALVAAVVAQHLFLKPRMTRAGIKFVQRLDIVYALAVIVVLATGLLQWFSVGKPAFVYSKNWIFHLKLMTFLVVGLISIYPSVFFGRNKKGDPNEEVDVPPLLVWSVRAELLLIFAMPLMAVLMSRGIGGFQ